VVSAPGQGTTFAVYLPEAAGAEDAPEPAPQPHTAHGTETVLVVEDEEAIRKMVVRTLGRLGYAVLQACDGVEALALAQAHPGPIHLLMTDVVMPRMSGGALAATLQAARGAIPVLYTSGHCDDAMARHGIQHEQVSFLPKPYALAQLGQRVREALEGHRAAG
jgi:CheY-like chemotaxis protein